jgi:hypothetical protein
MNRFKRLYVLVAVSVAFALLAVAPAAAAPGGNPPFESCGLGKPVAHEAIEGDTAPGASEAARVPPNLCRGKG